MFRDVQSQGMGWKHRSVYIETVFVKDNEAGDSDPLVSVVIFEWSDENLIGRSVSDDPEVCLPSVDADEVPALTHTLIGKRDHLRPG